MNANPVKKTIYKDVFGNFKLDTPEERKENLRIIETALSINNLDTLRALYCKGPLFDGDIPSKSERDWLIDSGFCVKVVVEGKDGFNACTHKGAWLNRCLDSLYKRFNQLELNTSLNHFRRMRDAEQDQELRSMLNDVCDRLGVFESKRDQRQKAGIESGNGPVT